MAIACEDDVVVVRRKVKQLSKERGFDPFSAAAITTATSEMSRNVWVHGGGGSATIEELTDGARLGIRIHFHDDGPGIAELDRVMKGGFSTARSLGLGVSGTLLLVDEFELNTEAGKGTQVTITKWTRY